MNITFVIPKANLSGGVRIIAEHALILHEHGHTVTVVAGRLGELNWKGKMKALLRTGRIPKLSVGPTHIDKAPYQVRTIERPRAIVCDDVPDADLIIATWWETAEWVAEMPKCKGVKVNFLQHYEAHPGQPKDRVDAVWRLPIRKIVVSRWLEMIAAEQFDDDTSILVPNGLDTTVFSMAKRGLSGQRIVGAMSSPASFKRFSLACDVVRELQSRGQDCRFVGFGVGPVASGVLPQGADFETSPSQERIAEIYSTCDCWLFTSDKEGYGLPLLESLACGTPVVATPAGAAAELLLSGGGRLVDSDDPQKIADAVEEIWALDDEAWRTMSQIGRKEAERHSWDVIGGQMEAALRQCLMDEH